jgi:hypothetical protein
VGVFGKGWAARGEQLITNQGRSRGGWIFAPRSPKEESPSK